MNWMIKVSIGMLLFATLLIALGVAFIRANEYKPAVNTTETKVLLPTIAKVPTTTQTPIQTPVQTPIVAEKIPVTKK